MKKQDQRADPDTEPKGDPRPLMLGMGWFPSTLGGLDRYFRALFEELPGAHAVVIGPAEGAPPEVAVVSSANEPLPSRLRAYHRAAGRAAGETEIVDAHFALFAASPLLLGRLRGRPAVFHFHGPWAEENVAVRDTSKLRFALRKRLERRVLGAADAHVVLSNAFRRVLVERYGISPWNVQVWPPGVALEVFSPGDRARARERLGIEDGAFVAACVRRLVPRMGIEVLLDAWERVESELPPGSTLLVVGDGPLADELSERAERGSLAGRVRMLGRVSDEDLIEVYRAADVAVVPTLAVEGYGLVVLEAAACGTPSIVSDVGGLREATAPLDGSLVIEPANPSLLGARLLDGARGMLPSREATREYAEGFSWPKLAQRHDALYRRLAAGERDQRLRVVYLDHVARLSGGEIAILRLLPYLEDVNAHVILAEEGLLAERLQEAGISVEVLTLDASARDLRKDSVGLGSSPRAALLVAAHAARLARRLRRLRPDVIHTNSLKSGIYGGLAAKAAGVPLVWHLRDRIATDYLPRPAVGLVRASIATLADGVIANSQATIDTISPRSRDRAWVIPDSVELSTHPHTPAGEGLRFGMLGRIAPWKGQDLFLRAFARAFPAGPERAMLVGQPMFGEEPFERELHELVSELGLGGRVEFRGFREDVWAELACIDVLVHASVIPEPFGQVVLEGMAAGLAVLAADEGGPADLIEDGRTGRLFASRDPEALATAMSALRADPAERERLGAAARGAAESYHPRTLAKRYMEAYEHVVSRPGRAAQARKKGSR
ncbi:MAG TPA: glycosyltransferase family 4 protein [Solirubrobacteraceae bacterium]|jgi:glycosyltransferase involved in cell wall biosynthesis|nr:glycosyltransferase family 4 protein [Solirubrobacteraceae bacterium]